MDSSYQSKELVWAKLKGYPWWPGVIKKMGKSNKHEVIFLGDFS